MKVHHGRLFGNEGDKASLHVETVVLVVILEPSSSWSDQDPRQPREYISTTTRKGAHPTPSLWSTHHPKALQTTYFTSSSLPSLLADDRFEEVASESTEEQQLGRGERRICRYVSRFGFITL